MYDKNVFCGYDFFVIVLIFHKWLHSAVAEELYTHGFVFWVSLCELRICVTCLTVNFLTGNRMALASL